jgi:hypothetical protein
LWFSGTVFAQEPDTELPVINWQELKTENFVIVYAESIAGVDPSSCVCGPGKAQFYASFIDDIYTDLRAVFEVDLETPINLRLFPTEESYFEVNPVAEVVTGVIAHALNNRQEIAVALPRTEGLTDDELINNMRHELTHLFASLLSDSKLNTGFQEGIAQYLEKPTAKTSFDPAILEQAYNRQILLSWADLDRAENVFKDPQVAYPQTFSMAAFLIDRYGFPKFVDFIKANATEPGFRSALEVTYRKSADALETEWLAYLPEYFAGRWKINSIYAYDLSRVRELVAGGAYSGAEVELLEIIALLETTNQTEVLAEAETLLAQAHRGQAANALADEARAALTANDYALTVTKGNAAIAAFEEVGYRQRIPEIQTYIQRAELGQGAIEQLNRGEELLESLRFFEAEKEIHAAMVMLQSLGNQAYAQRGEQLLIELTQRQSILAYAILAVGGVLLLVNGLRRLFYRFSAHPLEVEFT